MQPSELIVRVLLALLLPPLGVIGLPGVRCGTFLLLLLLIPCYMAVFRRIMRQRYFAAHYKAVMARK